MTSDDTPQALKHVAEEEKMEEDGFVDVEEAAPATTGVARRSNATTASGAASAAESKRLSTVSKAYNITGSGALNPAEQAMRDMDKSNRGYLTNDKVYGLMEEQFKMQKDMFKMKKILIGAFGLVVILALATLGTGFAAANLAKDTTTNTKGELTDKNTGEAVATADAVAAFDVDAPSDEDSRRLCTTVPGGALQCDIISYTEMSTEDALEALKYCYNRQKDVILNTHYAAQGVGTKPICLKARECESYFPEGTTKNVDPTWGKLCNDVDDKLLYIQPTADPEVYSISENDMNLEGAVVETADIVTSDQGEYCNADLGDADCDDGLFCKSATGACGGDGTCESIAGPACDKAILPVCGCDTVPYADDCDAFKAGQSIQDTMEGCTCTVGTDNCGDGFTCDGGTCKCIADSACGANKFCKRADGACDVAGTCVEFEQEMVCSTQMSPACGCDGKTYSNSCKAGLVTTLKHEGGCSCTDTDCVAGVEDFNSYTCDKTGTCVSSPECIPMQQHDCTGCPDDHDCTCCVCDDTKCQDVFGPNYSCDAYTNLGECVEAIESTGPCTLNDEETAAGKCCSNEDCPRVRGQERFCKGTAGACPGTLPDGGTEYFKGVCEDLPDGNCATWIDEVCGCDGIDYDSGECGANAAGTNVAKDGKCDGSGGSSGL